jgi:hypothetical protein
MAYLLRLSPCFIIHPNFLTNINNIKSKEKEEKENFLVRKRFILLYTPKQGNFKFKMHKAITQSVSIYSLRVTKSAKLKSYELFPYASSTKNSSN